MDFLPDYKWMQVNGRYRPLFRLFCSDRWKFVRKNGVPVEFDTAGDAVRAAKECVKTILNPAIRSEQTPEIAPDVLDVDEWQRQRTIKQAQEQQEAFGTIFVKHRAVKVAHVKRRARA